MFSVPSQIRSYQKIIAVRPYVLKPNFNRFSSKFRLDLQMKRLFKPLKDTISSNLVSDITIQLPFLDQILSSQAAKDWNWKPNDFFLKSWQCLPNRAGTTFKYWNATVFQHGLREQADITQHTSKVRGTWIRINMETWFTSGDANKRLFIYPYMTLYCFTVIFFLIIAASEYIDCMSKCVLY